MMNMKTYGNGMKATEFSKKQISVIYSKAKSGELKVEKWVIGEFYDLADYYNYDDGRSVERAELSILKILDAVFGGDMAAAQKLIDAYTDAAFALKGIKAQKKANRELVA
jgi:hypothetical protein